MVDPPSQPTVLLYYHIEPLEAHTLECEWHRALCERLRLHGRLRVSPQGLNGTLSGDGPALHEYAEAVTARHAGPRIDWKFSPCAVTELFRELSVRAVSEVVSLGVPLDEVPLHKAGAHLSPAEFRARRG